mmetsp:Transcript_43646/g.86096  ORF Transcript_43646/g.86096 Transcript_43646/m.86096 type:complete len:91 (-) Transcript_43646:373-645(-)
MEEEVSLSLSLDRSIDGLPEERRGCNRRRQHAARKPLPSTEPLQEESGGRNERDTLTAGKEGHLKESSSVDTGREAIDGRKEALPTDLPA